MTTIHDLPTLIPGCNRRDVDNARHLIADAKAFHKLTPERLRGLKRGIAALHAMVTPGDDAVITAHRMMYPSLRWPWERAVEELAEWLDQDSMLHAGLLYHHLGDEVPAYLTQASYTGMALALAYHLDLDTIQPTQFAPYVPYERTPEGMAEQDDRDVEYALYTWADYVRHQVKPALRGEWAIPTVPRLSRRLRLDESRVRAALNRLNREVAA